MGRVYNTPVLHQCCFFPIVCNLYTSQYSKVASCFWDGAKEVLQFQLESFDASDHCIWMLVAEEVHLKDSIFMKTIEDYPSPHLHHHVIHIPSHFLKPWKTKGFVVDGDLILDLNRFHIPILILISSRSSSTAVWPFCRSPRKRTAWSCNTLRHANSLRRHTCNTSCYNPMSEYFQYWLSQ